MHRAYAVIRLAIAITPLGLLAIWGVAYLRACWNVVLAPGVPIALDLKTPGGILSFSAASYSLNPRTGFLIVSLPKLRDPEGRTLVAAQLADATGIDLLDATRSALHIHVFGATGTIVRDADGRIELQSFLGKPTTQAQPIPFDVSIDRADLLVLDRKGGQDWSRHVTGRDINAAGIGSRWVAAGDVSIGQAGSGRISLSRSDDGTLAMHSLASNWQLADLGRHFVSTLSAEQTRKLGELDATSLTVSGPVDVAVPAKGSPSVSFQGTAEANGMRVHGYQFPHLKFSGRATSDGTEGTLDAFAPGEVAQLKGWVEWKGGHTHAAAKGIAKMTSVTTLPTPIRKLIPVGVSAQDVAYTGLITYNDANGFGTEGSFTALHGAYKEDAVDRLRGDVRVLSSSVWTRIDSATYRSAKANGEFSLDWKTHRLSGAVQGTQIPVETLLQRFPDVRAKIKGTPSGTLSAFAIISGQLSKPEVVFRIRGSGGYAEADLPRPIKIEGAMAEGRYSDGTIDLERLRARTPAGSIAASGIVDVRGRRLGLNVDGRGLDVADFTTSLSGLGSLSGEIVGTLSEPKFVGQVEGYDLSYQGTNLALLTASVTATLANVNATSLDLVVGSSQIKGNFGLNLSSKAVSGSFSSRGLQLGDILGEMYAGLVSVQTSQLTGTVDDPRMTLNISGKNLLAQDVEVSGLEARANLAGRVLTFDSLKAQTPTGEVLASGDYDIEDHSGRVSLTASTLDLAAILPSVQKVNKTALAGTITGSASIAFADKELTSATGTGTLKGLKANGTDLGAGIWNVSGNRHKLTGSVQASYDTRFLALENATIDLDASTLNSDVVISNLSIQNIYQVASPYLSSPGNSASEKLALFDGDVKLLGHLSGNWAHPDLDVTSLEAEKLSYNGIGFGNLLASGKRTGGIWDIESLNLADGIARGSAHGTIDESGETKLDGEVHNFDVSRLAGAFPGLPPIGGLVSSSFLATGPSDHPNIRATLDASSVALEGHRSDFGANFDLITLGPAGLDASGAVTYEGFHGAVVAHIPFAYPFTIPDDQLITAKLTLNQRPISDLSPYVATIDPTRADGAINGSLALTGRRDGLHLSGGITLRAASLGFRAVDPASKAPSIKYVPLATQLKDLVITVGVQDSAVTADVSVKSSQAGAIDGQLSSKVTALDELLNGHAFAELDTWLASPLTGKLVMNGVTVKEANRLSTTSFALDGNVKFDGTIAAPGVTGDVAVSNLATTIPGLSSQSGAGGTPLIDPIFNVGVELSNPGRIKTSLASIDLTGRGHIGGSLSQMDASASLGVVRGELRLPGGKVSLAPGGTVRPTYVVDANGTSDAHVAVDLYGDSHVTAVRNGDIAERYDVHLDVRGDLLVPEQVVFTATSDPPDLSQDQILALLGRTDLLNALGSNTGYAQNERQLQTAALGYALPSLFDPITSRLAANLGLDYLNVEFNALDQTSILASKTLGHGFSFQVRRQVSLPTPGFPISYDYRLVYQLPTRSRIIRRFSFFFGQDERTPWKLGLQYGQRL